MLCVLCVSNLTERKIENSYEFHIFIHSQSSPSQNTPISLYRICLHSTLNSSLFFYPISNRIKLNLDPTHIENYTKKRNFFYFSYLNT